MIYVSSSCIKKNRIIEILEEYAANGITHIELSGGTNYYPEIEKDLIDLKQRHRLEYACHAYFPPPQEEFVVNLASCNDEIYERSIRHYEECISMLMRVKCNTLSVHAGFLMEITTDNIGKKICDPIIYDEREAYERFCNAYKHIEDLCNKSNIRLYLENNVLSKENYEAFQQHNYFMMTDYESIMKMKEYISFDLLLDLGHLHVSANTLKLDYPEQCMRLKEQVKWIHVSDNNGIADQHKPLSGNSRILEGFNAIYDNGVNVTLETQGMISEILDSIDLCKQGA